MTAKLLHLPLPRPCAEARLYDARFRALIDPAAWERLPDQVKKRFTKRLRDGSIALYRGFVVTMEMSVAGWLLAQLCRLFGSPLPLCRSAGVPAVVAVSEDSAGGGQCWTRIYGRPEAFPQVIHSAKRFAGPTGLEEYLGRGLGMALRVEAFDAGISFVSDHYFLQISSRRFRLPQFLSPGVTRVTHRQIAGSAFLFELDLQHPLLGRLVHQQAMFEDVE